MGTRQLLPFSRPRIPQRDVSQSDTSHRNPRHSTISSISHIALHSSHTNISCAARSHPCRTPSSTAQPAIAPHSLATSDSTTFQTLLALFAHSCLVQPTSSELGWNNVCATLPAARLVALVLYLCSCPPGWPVKPHSCPLVPGPSSCASPSFTSSSVCG